MTIDEILAALQAIIDGASGRDLTDEEAERYETLEGQLTTARRSAELRSRQAAYLTPVATPAVATATADDDPHERAFDHYIRTGRADTDLAEYRAQSEGVDSAGGYLVPDGFRQKLVERLLSFGGLATQAETITTDSGNPLEWPTVDDTANDGEIVAEGGTFASGDDVVFGIATLGSFKYMAGGAGNLPLKVSWELLQDSAFDIRSFLTRTLATRINRIQSKHWVTGTGSGQPEGLLTPATAFDEITSNAAGPTYAELVGTVHALDPDYRTGARWLFNDATLQVIRNMEDGNARPLWLPQSESGMGAMPGGTLLGYPVIIDQAVPSIGDQTKFLAFGNFRESYVIRRVKGITLVVLNELYAANGQVGFMSWARADGAVQNPNAYVVLAGENTV